MNINPMIFFIFFRSNSGNPGYFFGLPVLFFPNETFDTLTDAESLLIQSPAPNAGSSSLFGVCPTDANAQEYLDTMEVKFGYDISSGCILSLNRF